MARRAPTRPTRCAPNAAHPPTRSGLAPTRVKMVQSVEPRVNLDTPRARIPAEHPYCIVTIVVRGRMERPDAHRAAGIRHPIDPFLEGLRRSTPAAQRHVTTHRLQFEIAATSANRAAQIVPYESSAPNRDGEIGLDVSGDR